MDRTDGLWFLISLPLLPIAACTGSGATDTGTDETTAGDSTTTTGGSTTDGSTTTTSGGTTTSDGSTTSDMLETSSETLEPSDDSTTYGCGGGTTGEGCSEEAEICIAYEAWREECDPQSPANHFSYCMHYVEDGGYGGEPCLAVAAEYYTCLSMLECGAANTCDQKNFVTICGHA